MEEATLNSHLIPRVLPSPDQIGTEGGRIGTNGGEKPLKTDDGRN